MCLLVLTGCEGRREKREVRRNVWLASSIHWQSCTVGAHWPLWRSHFLVLTGEERLCRMSQFATGGIGVPTNDGDTPNPANASEPAGLRNPQWHQPRNLQGRQARNPQHAPACVIHRAYPMIHSGITTPVSTVRASDRMRSVQDSVLPQGVGLRKAPHFLPPHFLLLSPPSLLLSSYSSLLFSLLQCIHF